MTRFVYQNGVHVQQFLEKVRVHNFTSSKRVYVYSLKSAVDNPSFICKKSCASHICHDTFDNINNIVMFNKFLNKW